MDKNCKKIIAEFSKFAEDYLNIPHDYKLILSFSRDNDKDMCTHGYYKPSENYIKVYAKNRCIADVLRSIGHEMVHHRQNRNHLLDKPTPDIGGSIEDEANAVTGQMVKKFGYDHPNFNIYDILI